MNSTSMSFRLIFAAALLHSASVLSPAVTFSLSGQFYEAVEWPTTGGGNLEISGSTTYSGAWSLKDGGAVTISGNTHVNLIDENNFPFTGAPYTGLGMDINGVDRFRVNNGQTLDSTGSPLTTNYAITSTTLPTKMLFYIGINNAGTVINGLKYASWNFSTSDTNTSFTVLGQTPSFVLTGDGTSGLSWKTFGSDSNSASILVSISNPDGISQFSVESNRLDVNGNPITHTNAGNQSDFNPIALLVSIPEPSVTMFGGLIGVYGLLRCGRRARIPG